VSLLSPNSGNRILGCNFGPITDPAQTLRADQTGSRGRRVRAVHQLGRPIPEGNRYPAVGCFLIIMDSCSIQIAIEFTSAGRSIIHTGSGYEQTTG
jgi:hypothetical protein